MGVSVCATILKKGVVMRAPSNGGLGLGMGPNARPKDGIQLGKGNSGLPGKACNGLVLACRMRLPAGLARQRGGLVRRVGTRWGSYGCYTVGGVMQCLRPVGPVGVVGRGVAREVGCVNTSSVSLSLFRDRCIMPGNVSCGSCVVLSRGVTIVSAVSHQGARR